MTWETTRAQWQAWLEEDEGREFQPHPPLDATDADLARRLGASRVTAPEVAAPHPIPGPDEEGGYTVELGSGELSIELHGPMPTDSTPTTPSQAPPIEHALASDAVLFNIPPLVRGAVVTEAAVSLPPPPPPNPAAAAAAAGTAAGEIIAPARADAEAPSGPRRPPKVVVANDLLTASDEAAPEAEAVPVDAAALEEAELEPKAAPGDATPEAAVLEEAEVEPEELVEEATVITSPPTPPRPPAPPPESPKPPPVESSVRPPAPPRPASELPKPPPPVEPTKPAEASPALVVPPWYREAFGEHYAALESRNCVQQAERVVDFFLEVTKLPPGCQVLDVGCGSGSHAAVLARRGYAATGLDLSEAQLRRADKRARQLGVELPLVQADMRDFHLEPFDALLCLGTTLGYFDDEGNAAAMRAMAAHIRPGGFLLLQVINRDHIISRLPARSWWQGRGCLVLDEAEMNYWTNRVLVHRTMVFEDGRQFDHEMIMRAYALHELISLCRDVGLEVLEVSGSRHARGRFYGATSNEIWLLASPA